LRVWRGQNIQEKKVMNVNDRAAGNLVGPLGFEPGINGDIARTIPFSLYSKDAVLLKIADSFCVLVEIKKILPRISF
jgi:hypothetical protein